MPADVQFFAASALAKRWGITRTTIYRMGETGELPNTKLGGSIRIAANLVYAYEEQHLAQGSDGYRGATGPGTEFLTSGDLSERWGIHRTTLYRMLERKEISHYRIRGSLRFPREVVEMHERRALGHATGVEVAA